MPSGAGGWHAIEGRPLQAARALPSLAPTRAGLRQPAAKSTALRSSALDLVTSHNPPSLGEWQFVTCDGPNCGDTRAAQRGRCFWKRFIKLVVGGKHSSSGPCGRPVDEPAQGVEEGARVTKVRRRGRGQPPPGRDLEGKKRVRGGPKSHRGGGEGAGGSGHPAVFLCRRQGGVKESPGGGGSSRRLSVCARG